MAETYPTPLLDIHPEDPQGPIPVVIVWRSDDGYYAMPTSSERVGEDWHGTGAADYHGPADTAAEAMSWATGG